MRLPQLAGDTCATVARTLAVRSSPKQVLGYTCLDSHSGGPSLGWEGRWDLRLCSGVRERWDGSLCRNVQFVAALPEVFMPDADHDR